MKKKILSVFLAAALALSLAACGGSAQSSGPAASGGQSGSSAQPTQGGTLTVGLSSAPVSMNVWVQNDSNSSVIMGLVCPPLVAMDEDGNKCNYLVESAEANEDATQWTVTLKDLFWSDGTPVTAEDLAFTATYNLEHHLSQQLLRGGERGPGGGRQDGGLPSEQPQRQLLERRRLLGAHYAQGRV